MIERNNLYFGWINTNIHNLLIDASDIITRNPLVLVTSIDSTKPLDTRTAKRICSDSTRNARMHGHGMLLPGSEVFKLIYDYNLFTGFDELWCFSSEPSAVKPESVSIVMPPKMSEVCPKGLVEWMKTSGCILGLGDGEGMNYITIYQHLAEEIEKSVITKL